MQKRALCAGVFLALALSLGSHAAAAENDVNIVVDGTALETEIATEIYNQTTYVSYFPVMQAIYPEATAAWEDGRAVVEAEGLSMTIGFGVNYIEANGRYLYLPDGVRQEGVEILVPARTLAKALGATAWWDAETNSVGFQSGEGPITPGDVFYQEDMLYWLSHIINAESGNQPLTGKIAVGNVIMNRVSDPRFPDNVRDVIFQPNQFSPVQNGSINKVPNEQSTVAAKLVMEGTNVVGDCLYFVNPNTSPNSWASRNRPFVATIGSHAFFE